MKQKNSYPYNQHTAPESSAFMKICKETKELNLPKEYLTKRHCILEHEYPGILDMFVPKENVQEIGTERLVAHILSGMMHIGVNSTDAGDAECKPVTTSQVGKDTEAEVEKERGKTLFVWRVYQLLKRYSYLWCSV